MPATRSVSVIIPVFGRVAGLAAALDSALGQSLPPCEVIVVDDGSHPPVVLPRRDPRIRLERLDANRGAAAARNAGCRIARGDWIAFLDADDVWSIGKLAVQLADASPDTDVLLACNVLIVGGTARRRYNHDAPRAPLDRWILVENQSLQTSGLVLPRRLALRFPFDETLRSCEDWDLVLRLDAAGVPIDYRADCLSSYVRPTAPAGRSASRIDAVIGWLERNDGLVGAEVALRHYVDHLLLPHLALDAPAALRTLHRMGHRVAGPLGIVATILWDKVRKRWRRGVGKTFS